jgi:hypothetical protein
VNRAWPRDHEQPIVATREDLLHRGARARDVRGFRVADRQRGMQLARRRQRLLERDMEIRDPIVIGVPRGMERLYSARQ